MLLASIEKALKDSCHHPELLSVMEYAVFPAGKLFRPKLVEALALDLNHEVTDNHLHLASAIELHHAYTLVHDDLPAMDNDLIRRGKPSTHAHFGEWKAILAGDALLISSFQAMMKIQHTRTSEIFRLMSWSTGAKGLIGGQFLDLLAHKEMDFASRRRIHELKTGRLIQLTTLGSYLLSKDVSFRGKIEFLRLGREIGVSFQLLDDLSELSSATVSDHEKQVNPFIHSTLESLHELRVSHSRLTNTTFKHRLVNVEKMLTDYFKNNQNELLKNFSQIEKNIGKDMTTLKEWITSFV